MTTVFLIAAGTHSYTFPAGISSITASAIGGGASGLNGGNAFSKGGGGGGGEARINVSLPSGYAGHAYNYKVGAGGAGTHKTYAHDGINSYFKSTAVLNAKQGLCQFYYASSQTNLGGTGGTGGTGYNGGNGGLRTGAGVNWGAGGGAGGPKGAGGNALASGGTPGAGGAGDTSSVASVGGTHGENAYGHIPTKGGAGAGFDASHGAGGGGGGSTYEHYGGVQFTAAPGGKYGGGGGGGAGYGSSTSGSGAQGIVVLSWTTGGAAAPSRVMVWS